MCIFQTVYPSPESSQFSQPMSHTHTFHILAELEEQLQPGLCVGQAWWPHPSPGFQPSLTNLFSPVVMPTTHPATSVCHLRAQSGGSKETKDCQQR